MSRCDQREKDDMSLSRFKPTVAPDWHLWRTLYWLSYYASAVKNICPAILWNAIKLSQAALDAMVSEKGNDKLFFAF